MNKILFMVILAVLNLSSFSFSPKKILKQINIARDLPDQGMRTLCNISAWSYWVYHDGGGGIQQDLNGNGIIEIGEREEPGYASTNQVIWYVTNDLDESRTTNLYGSQPMGLEIQTTLRGI